MGILINSVPFFKNYFLSSPPPPHLFLFCFVTFFLFISIYPLSHYLLFHLFNSIFCNFVPSSGSKPQPLQTPDSLLPSPNSKSPVFRTGSEPLLSPSFPRKSAEPLAGIQIFWWRRTSSIQMSFFSDHCVYTDESLKTFTYSGSYNRKW